MDEGLTVSGQGTGSLVYVREAWSSPADSSSSLRGPWMGQSPGWVALQSSQTTFNRQIHWDPHPNTDPTLVGRLSLNCRPDLQQQTLWGHLYSPLYRDVPYSGQIRTGRASVHALQLKCAYYHMYNYYWVRWTYRGVHRVHCLDFPPQLSHPNAQTHTQWKSIASYPDEITYHFLVLCSSAGQFW